jgi:hypothetical protein
MSSARYCVVKVRGPKPYAVLDSRHSRFVLDQDGGLLLSATAQDAALVATRVFNGENPLEVTR